ncbi:hypothetical protein [Flammeovirga sp. SubArs3]|uniref:hypothetical protein n=1 Tax=Flammeovirga sp. SubArs3 TaxID=2995316 RepID=UPI00248CEFE7|nr:hypothetical protein [Flammeovirga sp. SubArs3]
MKTICCLLGLIIIQGLTNAYGQDKHAHPNHEQYESYWSSLKEHNHEYTQQLKHHERLELTKIRQLVQQSVHQEMEEVKQLSGNLFLNFVVIEEHFHEEFTALGLSYKRYEELHPKTRLPRDVWVDYHTQKIIKHKLSKIDAELSQIHD